ncbi:pyridoxamine 5'-phosphate oxidase family protein [Methanimicrococcus sp. OttesenSCG-928-J09]|nr:pyridoxamine 5'-phosphate oxidase family protein [Methanimicrococcus sp. OttesenSCG-928-J09]
MDYLESYRKIVKGSGAIALATSVNDMPNVRIVNFCCDKETPSVLYFSTGNDNPKVIEFNENNRVAFTTIPADLNDTPHIRSHIAVVQKSDKTLDDLKNLFLEHSPGLAGMFEMAGAYLSVYEIHIKEATVIAGMEDIGTVSF